MVLTAALRDSAHGGRFLRPSALLLFADLDKESSIEMKVNEKYSFTVRFAHTLHMFTSLAASAQNRGRGRATFPALLDPPTGSRPP